MTTRKPKAETNEKGWHVVTAAHHAEFETYIRKWQVILNLRDWRIELLPERCKVNMAELVSVEHEHKLARVKLGTHFRRHPVTSYVLESTALHELLHLLLRPMIDNAIAEAEHGPGLAETEHAVIVLLDPLLMAAYGEQKGKSK